ASSRFGRCVTFAFAPRWSSLLARRAAAGCGSTAALLTRAVTVVRPKAGAALPPAAGAGPRAAGATVVVPMPDAAERPGPSARHTGAEPVRASGTYSTSSASLPRRGEAASERAAHTVRQRAITNRKPM